MKNSFRRKRLLYRTFVAIMSFYNPRVYRPILLVTFLAALVACTKDEDSHRDNPPAGGAPNLASTDEVTVSKLDTLVDIPFTIDEQTTSMQLIGFTDDQMLRLVEVEDPSGELIYESDDVVQKNLTPSGTFQNSPNTFDYPILANDRPLQAGTYRARYEIKPSSSFSANDISEDATQAVALSLVTKSDTDLSNGTVNVNALLSGTAANSRHNRGQIEEALSIVRQMLSRYGINVHIELIDVPNLPEVLPNPVTGDPLYEELAAVSDSTINLLIANDVKGLSAPLNPFAAAGSSPGPLVPSPRSGIAVSVSRSTGDDGLFDFEDEDDFQPIEDSETRIFAENIAHELLHYLGLQNSVDFSGGIVTSSDGLNSEKCSTQEGCQENDGANGNLMFPYPLLDEDSDREEFFPRDRLSSQQVEIVQRAAALN